MSDRRLDREIAERVLGYSVIEHRRGGGPCSYSLVDACLYPVAESSPTGTRLSTLDAWNDCPDFTVDLNYAWAVVTELQMTGYGFGLYGTDGDWVASFESGSHDEHEASAETAAEAICKAALLTVENGTLYEQSETGYNR